MFYLCECIVLKEGKKETIILYQGKTFYCRVNAENKVFPMYINVTNRFGGFQGIIGKTDTVLKQRDYDFMFSTNEYKVGYDNTESIKYIYIGITAVERLKMDLTIKFTPSDEPKKREVMTATQSDWKKKIKMPVKRNVYEFFKDGMRTEELEDLKELVSKTFYWKNILIYFLIAKIRKEKRIKSLALAGNRDLVRDNIETAREYKTMKIIQLEQLVLCI